VTLIALARFMAVCGSAGAAHRKVLAGHRELTSPMVGWIPQNEPEGTHPARQREIAEVCFDRLRSTEIRPVQKRGWLV